MSAIEDRVAGIENSSHHVIPAPPRGKFNSFIANGAGDAMSTREQVCCREYDFFQFRHLMINPCSAAGL